MNRKSLTKLTRRTALTLITLLQTTHCILYLLDRWTPPRKPHPYLCTAAKIFETGFFALTSYSFVEHNRDFRIGRHVIRGQGIDWLLWCVVVWSVGVVRNDVQEGHVDGLWSLWQLLVVDVVVALEQFRGDVTWIEREHDCEGVVGETGGKSGEVGEELNGKMEV
jgi:hypothetical protein